MKKEIIQNDLLRWMDRDISDEDVVRAIRCVPPHYSTANLQVQASITGQVTFNPAFTGGSIPANMSIGQGDWQAMIRQFTYVADDLFPSGVAHGTLAYFNQLTANSGGGNQNLDLTALSMAGASINFTKLKWAIIQLINPTTPGTDFLQVGPQALTNKWIGPFGAGTNATDWRKVTWAEELFFDPYGMFASVSGTNKVLGIVNPGANNITFNILLVGR